MKNPTTRRADQFVQRLYTRGKNYQTPAQDAVTKEVQTMYEKLANRRTSLMKRNLGR